jgi:hypothetical protein
MKGPRRGQKGKKAYRRNRKHIEVSSYYCKQEARYEIIEGEKKSGSPASENKSDYLVPVSRL